LLSIVGGELREELKSVYFGCIILDAVQKRADNTCKLPSKRSKHLLLIYSKID
jgi:hypothetical protein